MNTVAPKKTKREWWKFAAELLFAAWVIVINLLYYNQFKAAFLGRLSHMLHR